MGFTKAITGHCQQFLLLTKNFSSVCAEHGVQSHVNAIWRWGTDSRGETVSHWSRCSEQHVYASVTVETVR